MKMDSHTTDLIAIRTGAGVIAFPLAWSTSVVDEYDLVAVPNAPTWIVGATSVDGSVMPVVDLVERTARDEFLDTSHASRVERLLVGGELSETENYRIGFRFNDLPVQFSSKLAPAYGHESLPPILREAVNGRTQLPSDGAVVWVLDPKRLYDGLAQDATMLGPL
jgi:chemotaxis signal transduction protein